MESKDFEQPKVPNEVTAEAIKEGREMAYDETVPRCSSIVELKKALEKEINEE